MNKYSNLLPRAQLAARLDFFESCKQAEQDYSWNAISYSISDIETLILRNNYLYDFDGEVLNEEN